MFGPISGRMGGVLGFDNLDLLAKNSDSFAHEVDFWQKNDDQLSSTIERGSKTAKIVLISDY